MRQNQLEQYKNIYKQTTFALLRNYYLKTKNELRDITIYQKLYYITTTLDLNQFYYDEIITIEKNNFEK